VARRDQDLYDKHPATLVAEYRSVLNGPNLLGPGDQKYSAGGGWNNTQQPSEVTRDSAARAEGAQRTRDVGSVSSGRSSRTGSYRASGGGRAAGGGGRRR
jgi:hypothetical protein